MTKQQLYLLQPVELDANSVDLSSGPTVRRVQILRVGRWLHPKAPGGVLNITPELLEELKTHHDEVSGQIPMGQDHLDPYKRRAVSWATKLFLSEDKTKLEADVEFVDDKMLEDVKTGKVKFVSPEIRFNAPIPSKGGKLGNYLKAVDWTNLPFIQKMNPANVANLNEIEGLDLSENPHTKLRLAVEKLQPDEETMTSLHALLDDDGENLTSLSDAVATGLNALNASDDELQLALNELQSFVKIQSEVLLGEFDEKTQKTSNEGIQSDADASDNMNDPDSNDKQLPSQCSDCLKLSSNQCPFKGIETKVAAAGDGHCPQYISESSSDDPTGQNPADSEQGQETHMSENPENQNQNEVLALQKQIVELSESNVALQGQVAELSSLKSQVESLSATNRELARRAKVEKLSEGLTPKAREILLNIFSLDDGVEVKLNDGENANLEVLLTEFVGEIPACAEFKLLTSKKEQPDTSTTEVSLSAKGGTLDQRLPLIEERAKQLAKEEGGSWQSYYAKAARQLAEEAN